MNILTLIKRAGIADTEYQIIGEAEIDQDPVLAEMVATEKEVNKLPPPNCVPVSTILMITIIVAIISITVFYPMTRGASGGYITITDLPSFVCLIGLPLGVPALLIGVNIVLTIMAKAPSRVFYFPHMSISAVAEAINEKDKEKSILERQYHFITVSKNTESLGAYLVDCRRTHPGIFISADDLEEGLRNVGGRY